MAARKVDQILHAALLIQRIQDHLPKLLIVLVEAANRSASALAPSSASHD